MDTLGVWLRQTREAKGSTLEEVEIATRIRPRFLEALEAGDFSVFPGGEVQARGFLRIYARYLALPPEQVLARYDIEVHGAEAVPPGAPAEVQPASPTRPTTRPAPSPARTSASASRPGTVNLATLVVVGAAIITLLATIVAGSYFAIRNADEQTTTAAAATPTAPGRGGVWPTATAIPTLLAVTPTFPVNPDGSVTLTLEASEHVWTRVTVDGLTVFEGMLPPEQIETWSGQQVISVDTGNGDGLSVTVNGQLQGTMCGRAEVCSRAWGPTGEIVVP
jgi:cytoskeleton protein RodZ